MRVPAERILIVLLGAIGDVARALPLAMRVRAGYPGAHVAWAVEPAAAPLLEGASRLDERIVFERGGGARAFWRFLRRVRAGRFDLVLDLQRHAEERAGERRLARAGAGRLPPPQREGAELALQHAHDRAGGGRGWKLEQYLRFADVSSLPEVTPTFGDHACARTRRRTSRRWWRRAARPLRRWCSPRRGRAGCGFPRASRRSPTDSRPWARQRPARRCATSRAIAAETVAAGARARRSISPAGRRCARLRRARPCTRRGRAGLRDRCTSPPRRGRRWCRCGARRHRRARRRSAPSTSCSSGVFPARRVTAGAVPSAASACRRSRRRACSRR